MTTGEHHFTGRLIGAEHEVFCPKFNDTTNYWDNGCEGCGFKFTSDHSSSGINSPMTTDELLKIAEDALCKAGFCLIGGEWIAPDDVDPAVKFEQVDEHHIDFLWYLLEDRPKDACISHRQMPSREKHAEFVRSKPYEIWYVIKDYSGALVGSCYITKANEIGVDIHRNFRSRGFGSKAVKRLMSMHGPRKWLANIAPLNHTSQGMFAMLGFRQLQQVWVKDE